MKFWDADVKKPFRAVSAIVDEGNTVVFSRRICFIQNDESGEEIEMKQKGGTYVIEPNADDNGKANKENAGRMDVGGMDDEDDDGKLQKLIQERYGEGEVIFMRRVR